MFKFEENQFGKFKKLKLINSLTREYVAIIPEFGANVNEIVFKKNGSLHSILNGDPNYKALIKNRAFKGAKLIPFSNRIKNGSYHFENQKYFLKKNFWNSKDPIHGMIYDQKFEIISKSRTLKYCQIILKTKMENSHKGYPFPIDIQINYTFSNKGLKVETILKNVGTNNCPLGDGWHPYFKFTGKVDQWFLKLPKVNKLCTDKNNIPSGVQYPYESFSSPQLIGKNNIDASFYATGTSNKAVTKLISADKKLTINLWQEIKNRQYQYIQVFTPTERDSIAIEPMTSPANSFNNKMGFIQLNPGESLKATYGVFMD